MVQGVVICPEVLGQMGVSPNVALYSDRQVEFGFYPLGLPGKLLCWSSVSQPWQGHLGATEQVHSWRPGRAWPPAWQYCCGHLHR